MRFPDARYWRSRGGSGSHLEGLWERAGERRLLGGRGDAGPSRSRRAESLVGLPSSKALSFARFPLPTAVLGRLLPDPTAVTRGVSGPREAGASGFAPFGPPPCPTGQPWVGPAQSSGALGRAACGPRRQEGGPAEPSRPRWGRGGLESHGPEDSGAPPAHVFEWSLGWSGQY